MVLPSARPSTRCCPHPLVCLPLQAHRLCSPLLLPSLPPPLVLDIAAGFHSAGAAVPCYGKVVGMKLTITIPSRPFLHGRFLSAASASRLPLHFTTTAMAEAAAAVVARRRC